MKLKKGDNVIVITGKSKGAKGAIVRVFPATSQVLIDGVNLVKRHRRPSQQSRTGQIVDKPMPIHVSNVQLADPKGGKPTRIRIVRGKDGVRERVAVKSGQKIA
jgi:large subunit ribosomal protein L24